ncbi:MAG TPA: SDR family NAD(P)-dependent oxidoreductase [Terriglobales bacterium]|nr:SDR family NAD(P)-dependent oxidoreductase [Terriglobales bacterium]
MSGKTSYALVTGASRGIGAALAEALAGEGWNLILSARSGADLEHLRARLARPGIAIQCVPADLRTGGAAALLAEVARQGWEVELLVNNAGLGSGGEFAGLALERELEEVKVNVAALVELTHGCLAGMRARGRGAVMQVASTAAFQPVPYMATYAATKAFVLHFSLGLHEELRRAGIHVMALCPGPTQTNFFEVAGLGPRRGATAEAVARQALAGLKSGRAVVVCGGSNRAMVAVVRLLPRGMVARVVARMMKSWQPTA